MTTLSKWINPKTDEARVYVNKLPGQPYGVKIFLVKGEKRVSDNNHDWECVIIDRDRILNRSRDEITDSIDYILKEMAGGKGYVGTFERILELSA